MVMLGITIWGVVTGLLVTFAAYHILTPIIKEQEQTRIQYVEELRRKHVSRI